jgi:hypothetical protein
VTAGEGRIADWITNDPLRWELLGHVDSLALPDCWVAAGFVRNAVWSHLHGIAPVLKSDIDVIWFSDSDASEATDRKLEGELRHLAPGFDWSVKNQARMHLANGDRPYRSCEDAMRFWPETATAVAVRRKDDLFQMIAPFGVEDLLQLRLRPAGAFATRKRAIFENRVREKGWLRDFARLEVVG